MWVVWVVWVVWVIREFCARVRKLVSDPTSFPCPAPSHDCARMREWRRVRVGVRDPTEHRESGARDGEREAGEDGGESERGEEGSKVGRGRRGRITKYFSRDFTVEGVG